MKTTTISSKGQITLPVEVLKQMGLASGTKLLVVPMSDGVLLLRRPDSLAEALGGATAGTYGDVESYVETERASWT